MGRLNEQGNKKQVGTGLSLEKFAEAKVSKYNKRQVLEKRQEEKLRRRSKYNKLRKQLEAEGKLAPPFGGSTGASFAVVDNVATLDEDLLSPEFRAAQEALQRKKQRRGDGGGAPGDKSGERAASKAADAGLEEDGGPPAPPSSSAPGRAGQGPQVPSEGPAAGPSGRFAPNSGPNGKRQQQQERSGPARAGSKGGPATGGDAAGQGGGGPATPAADNGPSGGDVKGRHVRPPRALSQIERLSTKIQGVKADERQIRDEALRVRAEKQEKYDAAQRARQQDKRKFMMRTASGQPLLKFRMDKILATLAGDKSKAKG